METELKKAIKVLVKNLKDDSGYRYSWQANIAMAFKDEYENYMMEFGEVANQEDLHAVANNAANRFLDLLCRDSK